jgi:hypothetical protein
MIIGALIFLGGFIVGALAFRNNPVLGDRIAKQLESKMNEMLNKPPV